MYMYIWPVGSQRSGACNTDSWGLSETWKSAEIRCTRGRIEKTHVEREIILKNFLKFLKSINEMPEYFFLIIKSRYRQSWR